MMCLSIVVDHLLKGLLNKNEAIDSTGIKAVMEYSVVTCQISKVLPLIFRTMHLENGTTTKLDNIPTNSPLSVDKLARG